MTQWFPSTSLWKTIWPVSGHLTHRFSGVSRLNRVLILGRTTSEIQFIGSTIIQTQSLCANSVRAAVRARS